MPEKTDDKKQGKKGVLGKYKWWAIGGLAVVAILVFFFVNKSKQGQAGQGTTGGSQPGIDPATGLPYASEYGGMFPSGAAGAGLMGPAGPAGPPGPPGPRGQGPPRPKPKPKPKPKPRPHRHHRGHHEPPTNWDPFSMTGMVPVVQRPNTQLQHGAQIRRFNSRIHPVPIQIR